MHSVCVCEIHQNVKLQLAAVPGKLDYKEVLAKMVCSLTNRDCMLHACEQCGGTESARHYLEEQFANDDMDDDDIVTYKQLLHTDRTILVSLQLPVNEFIHTLCKSLDSLRNHHFISKAQAAYVRSVKDSLEPGTAVILMDFAENYCFIIQDAVQGHHWNNSQTTLHPFTVYYKDTDDLKSLSICVVSDHLEHNTNTVHAFMSRVLAHIKNIIPIQRIVYFTDGAAPVQKL